jgi:hypothetical protein
MEIRRKSLVIWGVFEMLLAVIFTLKTETDHEKAQN